MTRRLEGKTALITGASRGIGAAIAEACAAAGANLALCARQAPPLERLAARLREEYGIDALACPCDVADRDAVQAAVARAEAWRPLDVLVNNAGVYAAGRFVDFPAEEFRRMLEVNVLGVVRVTQAVLPGMIARGAGRVINLASTAGKWGTRNQSAYNASKHAVIGLTRCLALELAPKDRQVPLRHGLAVAGLEHGDAHAVDLAAQDVRHAAQAIDVAAGDGLKQSSEFGVSFFWRHGANTLQAESLAHCSANVYFFKTV